MRVVRVGLEIGDEVFQFSSIFIFDWVRLPKINKWKFREIEKQINEKMHGQMGK